MMRKGCGDRKTNGGRRSAKRQKGKGEGAQNVALLPPFCFRSPYPCRLAPSKELLQLSGPFVISHYETIIAVSRVDSSAKVTPNGVFAAIVGQQRESKVTVVLIEQAAEISKTDSQVGL